jgi:hypothetical protein
MNDPVIVSRDNPWFEGWYNAPPGRWLSAAGTYSHVYGASPFAGGFIRTWEFSEPGWSAFDDWQTPIRGDVLAGYGGFQTSDELGWLSWAVRAGNLVPGGLYAVALANSAGPSASTWYKLDDNVLVVPVVVIAWHTNNIYAGSAAAQDYRSRASALFDFIPFRGSRTSNWPTDWLEPSVWPWTKTQADDPTADYDPPDDVWSQCGIQFQVVRVFRFPFDFSASPCQAHEHNFADPTTVRDPLIDSAIGPVERAILVDELAPVFANFGYLNCANFFGNAVPEKKVIELDRADLPPPSNLVAHELGHVLLGAGHHSSPQNLMAAAPANAHALTEAQCQSARVVARDLAARFWDYNAKTRRIRAQNPHTPVYVYGEDPVSISTQQSCCEFSGEKSWTTAGECVGVGGEILPDAKCTECCEVSQIPLIGRFKPLDECPDERVRPDVKCDKVCCSLATPMGNQFQFMSRLQCENTFGATLVATSYCENPR